MNILCRLFGHKLSETTIFIPYGATRCMVIGFSYRVCKRCHKRIPA